MTFLELCQTLRREIALSGEGPSTVVGQTGQTAQFVGLIQAADYYVQSLYTDWKFLWSEWEEPTVNGTEVYTPPSDLNIWDTESFYLDWGTEGAIPLTVLTEREDLKMLSTREIDKPTMVTILPDNTLKLNPIPDDIYTLTASYYKKPVLMTANTDTSLIPEQFHRIIIERAKVLYAESEEAFNLMQSYMMNYRELLFKLEAHSLQGQDMHSRGQHAPLIVRPV